MSSKTLTQLDQTPLLQSEDVFLLTTLGDGLSKKASFRQMEAFLLSVSQSAQIQRNAKGFISQITEDLGSGQSRYISYTYDSLDFITVISVTTTFGFSKTFHYQGDAVGNVIEVTTS